MQPFKITIENIEPAKQYLQSINKLEEFNNKATDPSQWSAIILFANQQILSNTNQG